MRELEISLKVQKMKKCFIVRHFSPQNLYTIHKLLYLNSVPNCTEKIFTNFEVQTFKIVSFHCRKAAGCTQGWKNINWNSKKC